MTSFVLIWDGSEAGYAAGKYERDVASTAAGGTAPGRWSMGSRRGGTAADDRVFLLRQENNRGIVASGRLTDGEIFQAPHYADPNRTARYSYVTWDTVLPIADRLPFDNLRAAVPDHPWNTIYGSGQQLKPPSDEQLEALWKAHVHDSRPQPAAWNLAVGQTLGRQERMRLYGGAIYGDIQPSRDSPNVFVYSDPTAGTANGYTYDGWNADGTVFLYTGEGRIGHQQMRAGNAAMFNHHQDGRALRLFVADGTEPGSDARIQRYVGEFRLDDTLPVVTAEAPDSNGDARTVLVFRLRPVGEVLVRRDDASPSGDAPTTGEADRVPLDAAAAAPGSAEPVPLEALTSSSYIVNGSTATTATKREAELVARFQAHLEQQGHECVRYRVRPPGELRDLYTDLLDATDNVLYEAKGVATREAVRMALGQLYDYSRHIKPQPALAVLLPARPSHDLSNLLARHRVACLFETAPGRFAAL